MVSHHCGEQVWDNEEKKARDVGVEWRMEK